MYPYDYPKLFTFAPPNINYKVTLTIYLKIQFFILYLTPPNFKVFYLFLYHHYSNLPKPLPTAASTPSLLPILFSLRLSPPLTFLLYPSLLKTHSLSLRIWLDLWPDPIGEEGAAFCPTNLVKSNQIGRETSNPSSSSEYGRRSLQIWEEGCGVGRTGGGSRG